MSTDHVRADEIVGTEYRAIDVRLGSEMHECVDVKPLHDLAYGILVADVLAYECIAGIALQAFEILGIPGIGERIQHDHAAGSPARSSQ